MPSKRTKEGTTKKKWYAEIFYLSQELIVMVFQVEETASESVGTRIFGEVDCNPTLLSNNNYNRIQCNVFCSLLWVFWLCTSQVSWMFCLFVCCLFPTTAHTALCFVCGIYIEWHMLIFVSFSVHLCHVNIAQSACPYTAQNSCGPIVSFRVIQLRQGEDANYYNDCVQVALTNATSPSPSHATPCGWLHFSLTFEQETYADTCEGGVVHKFMPLDLLTPTLQLLKESKKGGAFMTRIYLDNEDEFATLVSDSQ